MRDAAAAALPECIIQKDDGLFMNHSSQVFLLKTFGDEGNLICNLLAGERARLFPETTNGPEPKRDAINNSIFSGWTCRWP